MFFHYLCFNNYNSFYIVFVYSLSCRSLLNNNTEDVNRQISAVRQREKELQRQNNDLQHKLVDVESKMSLMEEKNRGVEERVCTRKDLSCFK